MMPIGAVAWFLYLLISYKLGLLTSLSIVGSSPSPLPWSPPIGLCILMLCMAGGNWDIGGAAHVAIRLIITRSPALYMGY